MVGWCLCVYVCAQILSFAGLTSCFILAKVPDIFWGLILHLVAMRSPLLAFWCDTDYKAYFDMSSGEPSIYCSHPRSTPLRSKVSDWHWIGFRPNGISWWESHTILRKELPVSYAFLKMSWAREEDQEMWHFKYY